MNNTVLSPEAQKLLERIKTEASKTEAQGFRCIVRGADGNLRWSERRLPGPSYAPKGRLTPTEAGAFQELRDRNLVAEVGMGHGRSRFTIRPAGS